MNSLALQHLFIWGLIKQDLDKSSHIPKNKFLGREKLNIESSNSSGDQYRRAIFILFWLRLLVVPIFKKEVLVTEMVAEQTNATVTIEVVRIRQIADFGFIEASRLIAVVSFVLRDGVWVCFTSAIHSTLLQFHERALSSGSSSRCAWLDIFRSI